MDYHHFKISKASFRFLLLKLAALVGAVFLFSKLRFEVQQLSIMPNQVVDLVFIICCLALGWMYRIVLDEVYLSTNERKIKVKVAYNLYGFVFVRVLSADGLKVDARLWNPTNFRYSVSDRETLECIFKPDNKLPKGGCRLIKG